MKKFQDILDINIVNFRLFSRKCIILEQNGKGKEYESIENNLLFEGEYLNGKRNGKGKQYEYGKL